MAETKQVRIVMTDHGLGEVFIDGEKVPGLHGFEFVAEAGGFNRLTLHRIVCARSVAIEAKAEVEEGNGG